MSKTCLKDQNVYAYSILIQVNHSPNDLIYYDLWFKLTEVFDLAWYMNISLLNLLTLFGNNYDVSVTEFLLFKKLQINLKKFSVKNNCRESIKEQIGLIKVSLTFRLILISST